MTNYTGLTTVESQIPGGFYAPEFMVRINGANLPQNVLRDVASITYTDNVDELDGFEISLNNWDSDTGQFKFVGGETKESLKKNPMHSLISPCHEVEIDLGYAGALQHMMTGNFTTMEPNFPSGGSPTLAVRGLNILHKFRTKKITKTWRDKSISQAVKSLKRELSVSVETSASAMAKEKPRRFLAMRDMYPINFILDKARELNYVAYLKESDSEKKLYFGPSEEGSPDWSDDSYDLRWGESLIDFKPTLTTANQLKSVTVRGWNRSTRQPIAETASLDDPKDVRKLAIDALFIDWIKCDARETTVVNEPVFTEAQAKERALAILGARVKQMVKGSGTTIGLPGLRAGKRIKISNLGARFNGVYFVTETMHTISDSGYTTRFSARKEDAGK